MLIKKEIVKSMEIIEIVSQSFCMLVYQSAQKGEMW